MALLTGKKLLITGISSNRSIAYGIAKACKEEGAELILTYNNERFRERLERFANDFGAAAVIQLNVASDESIEAAAARVKEVWPEGFDGFVHSIAWAPREAIEGSFLEGLSREGFMAAINISAYSFAALAKAFLPQLEGRKASLVTLSFLGAEKVVPPISAPRVSVLTPYRAVRSARWRQAALRISKRCSLTLAISRRCVRPLRLKMWVVRPRSCCLTMH